MLPAAEDALALSSGSEEELERRAEKQICLLLSKGEKDNKTARKKRGFYLFRVEFHPWVAVFLPHGPCGHELL